MINSTACVLCENIVRDGDTNTVSLISLIEQLHSPAFPLFLHKVGALISLLREEGDPDNVQLTMRMLIDDREVFRNNVQVGFQGRRQTRAIFRFNGIIIPNPGHGRIEFRIEERVVGSWPFEIDNVIPQRPANPVQVFILIHNSTAKERETGLKKREKLQRAAAKDITLWYWRQVKIWSF